MNNYVDNMFKIPLLHLEIKNWKVKKEILLEMVNNSNLIMEGESKVKTDFHTKLNNDEFVKNHNDKILEILSEEVEIFSNYFNFNSCTISSSWFELADQGNYHGIHNHGSIGYSSVCYIDYDKNIHTPTKFISPFHNFLTGDILQYKPNVEEGSIIFFPSVIMHYTEPNDSKLARKILSFNLTVK